MAYTPMRLMVSDNRLTASFDDNDVFTVTISA